MKKIILTLTAALLLLLTSCSGGIDADEVIAAAGGLIEASYELNDIYYGKGLPFVEPEDGKTVLYADVDTSSPYMTEEELRAATLDVFTEEYADVIFSMFLVGYSDDEIGGVVYARYVQSGDRLSCSLSAEPMFDTVRTYKLSSANVLKLKKSTAVIEFDTLVGDEPGGKVRVTLKRNDGGEWRIDSPTY